MGLFGWLSGRRGGEDDRLAAWRAAWAKAAEAQDTRAAAGLRAQLDAFGLPDEEVEVEREMLDGLEALEAVQVALTAGALPAVETGHRVVGSDVCHFSAPASMPDEPSQPSGRLLLTHARAVFAGGSGQAVA